MTKKPDGGKFVYKLQMLLKIIVEKRWNQRCGTRIRIRDPVLFLKLKNQIRICDENFSSYFRELRNNFFCLKYLNSLMRIRIRDRESF
jgi:hypothetical protein